MDLLPLAQSYMNAMGYEVSRKERDLLLGTRMSLAQETETILIWVPAIDLSSPWGASREGPYITRFKEATDKYPVSQKFMLIENREGFSQDFRSGSKRWYNVNIRVPVEFFDTPFKAEESPEAVSAINDLRRRGDDALKRRIPQPYLQKSTGQAGTDLIETLFQRLRRPTGQETAHIALIVGPAGIGKTFLFEALFSRLQGAFLQDKATDRVGPRPLVPEYLRYSDAATIRALTRAFLSTDFARPIQGEVFQWMMSNGYALWMLDGLDEVIERDTEFFGMYLLELLTHPGTVSPRIVIFVRDSLLATNDELRDFCEDNPDSVEVYELSRWGLPSKAQFAKRTIPARADDFLTLLKQRPEIDELSATPYYCQLLVDMYESDRIKDSYTETTLLSDAVSSIVNREYDKGLLDRHLVPEAEVLEFLEALAAADMWGGFQGVAGETLRDWAQVVLPTDLGREQLTAFVVQMTQLPVFSLGAGVGNVRFAQELIEQLLLGQYFAKLLAGHPDVFLRRIGIRPISAEWVTLKVIAERVRREALFQSVLALAARADSAWAFRNLAQLAALSADSPRALEPLIFEQRDLSGVVFRRLNLETTSFRGSDLTDVRFEGCNLKQAVFAEAILKNTAFELPTDDLLGAQFGDLSRFYSVVTEGGKILSDPRLAGKWIDDVTGMRAPIVEPCAPAQQLRHLFGKFVYPNGRARRAILDRRGVLAGKRLSDPEGTLRAAVRYGYLREEERFRDRLQRAEGDLYSQMVEYAKNYTLTPGLREVLSETCADDHCLHVPAAHQ